MEYDPTKTGNLYILVATHFVRGTNMTTAGCELVLVPLDHICIH